MDTTLSPAQDRGSDDLGATIAAAIEDQENTDIIGELASASDDPPDSPETPDSPEAAGDGGEDGPQTDETDPPPAAVGQEADTGPERSADATPEHRQIAEAFGSAVSPYQAYLASKGVSAPQAVQILLAAEYQLSTGTPEQKAKIMAQLAKDYGVDLDALYDVEEAAPASPEIAQLQQRQANLERMVNGERQQVVAQMRQEVVGQVAAFAGEKDAAGNLLHPHLQQVQVAMGQPGRSARRTAAQSTPATSAVGGTMADRSLFTLDAKGRWRLAYDSNQWIIQRRKGPARPANRSGIAESGWRGVSFVGGKKATLARLFREKGIFLTPEAQARFDALPERFLDFIAAPASLAEQLEAEAA